MEETPPASVIRQDADSICHANKTHLTATLRLQPPTAPTDQYLLQTRLLRLPIPIPSEQFPGN